MNSPRYLSFGDFIEPAWLLPEFFQFSTAPFTCEYEGKRYRAYDKFYTGDNGCVECVCINGQVDCDSSKCQPILVEPPEVATDAPVKTNARASTTTTTTTTRPSVARPHLPSSEKGPSPSDYSYFSNQLADVNSNPEKGPNTDAMSFSPEQYSYLQAQLGAPGSRGPPGLPGASGSPGSPGQQGTLRIIIITIGLTWFAVTFEFRYALLVYTTHTKHEGSHSFRYNIG